MKTIIMLFSVLVAIPLTAKASEYTGEKILNYLPEGHHVGANCSMDVEVSDDHWVMVSIQSGGDYANFNTSLLRKKDIAESAKQGEYRASFVLIPDDEYSGLTANRIQILKQNQKTTVSLKMLRRFLGVWKTDRSASCTLNF